MKRFIKDADPEDRVRERIVGALFDFLGHLTTMPRTVTFGASALSPPALTELETWAKKRSLNLDRADVTRWENP